MSACPYCQEPLPEAAKPAKGPKLYGCTVCYNPFYLEWEGPVLKCTALKQATDIRATAPAGSIGGAILEAMPKAIERLPVLPEISQRVLALVRDPDVSMKDVANLVRQDQVVALSLMRMANSATYGGLTEIKDLNSACSRLGMKMIANVVQTVASNNLFVTGDKRLKGFMKKLWRHSIATAHCANAIALSMAEPRSETLFLAGLVHDIGKVMLLDIITGQYTGAIAELRVTPDLLREVIDSFHPLLGLHIAQRWNLPPEFAAILYFHHHPSATPHEEWTPMVHTVALANLIAKVEGFGLYEVGETYLTSDESARYLNMNDIKLAGLRVDLADLLEPLFETAGAEEKPAGD